MKLPKIFELPSPRDGDFGGISGMNMYNKGPFARVKDPI